MIKNISNLGDAALYCDFGSEINKEINLNVIKYFRNLQKINLKEVTNITPSYNKLIISYDLSMTNFKNLKKKIENIKIEDFENLNSKIIKIPICLDKEFSLDLNRLSKKLKMNEEEIVKSFLKKNYFCYMTGFIAGMPFLGDLENKIRLQFQDPVNFKKCISLPHWQGESDSHLEAGRCQDLAQDPLPA